MGELTFVDKNEQGEEVHEYYHDGKLIDHTTGILDEFIKYKADSFYLRRGSAVHLACQLHDENDLVEPVNKWIRPWLYQYKLFLKETGFKVRNIEVMYHHHGYLYATREDRDGWMGEDLSLLELKSGGYSKWWGWQLALQEIASGIKYKKRFALALNGGAHYQLHPFHERKWLSEAQAILTVNALRRENNGRG